VIIECAASRLYDPEIAAVMIEGGDEGVTLPNRMFCEDVLNSHNNWLPTRDGVFQDCAGPCVKWGRPIIEGDKEDGTIISGLQSRVPLYRGIV
jgi:hypothetical protein